MKRAIFLGLLAGILLSASPQDNEPRVYVDYRQVMIPMRDGVRLETVILTPKGSHGPLPFLIDRTPYGVPAEDTVAKGLPARQRWRSENYYYCVINIFAVSALAARGARGLVWKRDGYRPSQHPDCGGYLSVDLGGGSEQTSDRGYL